MNFRMVFDHWRLGLLGVTSLALSLASGWTTWDGMSNFTKEPALSALIAFGVQAVMLVTAWMLGETFANRFQPRTRRPQRGSMARMTIILTALVSLLLIATVAGALGDLFRLQDLRAQSLQFSVPAPQWTNVGVIAGGLAAALVFASRTLTEQVIGVLRAIVENALLWVMFVACIATSVFFSFDSLFSVLFSPEDRSRAAVTRSISASDQLAGRVRAAADEEKARQRTELLRSTAWSEYSRKLDALIDATTASATTRAQKQQTEAESRHKARALDSQRLAELEVQLRQAELRRQTEERRVADWQLNVTRSRERVATLSEQLAEQQSAAAIKRSEARAEEQGLALSAVAGQGPRYRALTRETAVLEAASLAAGEQVRLATVAAEGAMTSLRAAQASLSAAAGVEARLKSEIGTHQMRASASVGGPQHLADEGDRLRALQKLAAARFEFERVTTRDALQLVQERCLGLTEFAHAGGVAHAAVDCKPLGVHEAAAALFRLEEAAVGLAAACRLSNAATVDQAIIHARACLGASGLPDARAVALRHEIDTLARNRDDKAHRFVVSWNAFVDGNPLAMLALALALGIDGLVFVAGLLGATAVRSQFASLPRTTRHSVRWAEKVICHALQPDSARTVYLALTTMRPASVAAQSSDAELAVDQQNWTHEISLQSLPPSTSAALRRLVNAATVIGAARPLAGSDTHYLLRVELVEFLTSLPSSVSPDDHEMDERLLDCEALSTILEPAPARHAALIVSYLAPTTARKGFATELQIASVAEIDRFVVRRFLNAMAVHDAVHVIRPADDGGGAEFASYLLRRDVSAALEQIIATARHPTEPDNVSAVDAPKARNAAVRAQPPKSVPEPARADRANSYAASQPVLTAPPQFVPTLPAAAASVAPPSDRTSDRVTERPLVTISGDGLRFD